MKHLKVILTVKKMSSTGKSTITMKSEEDYRRVLERARDEKLAFETTDPNPLSLAFSDRAESDKLSDWCQKQGIKVNKFYDRGS